MDEYVRKTKYNTVSVVSTHYFNLTDWVFKLTDCDLLSFGARGERMDNTLMVGRSSPSEWTD